MMPAMCVPWPNASEVLVSPVAKFTDATTLPGQRRVWWQYLNRRPRRRCPCRSRQGCRAGHRASRHCPRAPGPPPSRGQDTLIIGLTRLSSEIDSTPATFCNACERARRRFDNDETVSTRSTGMPSRGGRLNRRDVAPHDRANRAIVTVDDEQQEIGGQQAADERQQQVVHQRADDRQVAEHRAEQA